MVEVSKERITAIGEVLNNKERPLKERFRALFTLRNIGGVDCIREIEKCFKDDSALLKHELAYCLGQMQDPRAVSVLIDVLKNTNEEPMVRHEAAEALGAIGTSEVKLILEKYKSDPVLEVAETCEIALDRVNWINDKKLTTVDDNPYSSVDPSPPADTKDVQELERVYLDENEKLFDRYRAMFRLRNLHTPESIAALGKGLKCKSALFRHEVAFVLGQMQDPISIPYLTENLQDKLENEMVRHECAEALGAIATQDCINVLNEYLKDEKRVVRESCEIALDMCDYENSPEFQYADTLVKISSE